MTTYKDFVFNYALVETRRATKIYLGAALFGAIFGAVFAYFTYENTDIINIYTEPPQPTVTDPTPVDPTANQNIVMQFHDLKLKYKTVDEKFLKELALADMVGRFGFIVKQDLNISKVSKECKVRNLTISKNDDDYIYKFDLSCRPFDMK